jgi:hypothetical protein
MRTKAKLHAHTRQRAEERYDGLKINHDEMRTLMQQIRDGSAVFLKRYSHTRTEWLVILRDTRLRVIYDNNHKAIRTVLPV